MAAALLVGVSLWLTPNQVVSDGGRVLVGVAAEESAPKAERPESMAPGERERPKLVEWDGDLGESEPTGAELAVEVPEGFAPSCNVVVRVVFDDDGRTPAAGATIEVGRERDVPGAYEGTDFVFESHLADDQGLLTLPTTCEETALYAWLEFQASDSEYLELQKGSVHEVELVLAPCLSVVGRVVNQFTQQPIVGAEVWIPTFNRGSRVVTDANGRYEMLRYPAAENHGRSLQVQADGFGTGQRTIMVGEGGAWTITEEQGYEAEFAGSSPPILLDFELLPQVSYVGRVIDSARRPVVGAKINARGYYSAGYGVFSPDTAASVTDAEGVYRLDGLRADTAHTLWFRADGFGTALRHSYPQTRGNGDLGVTLLSPASSLSVTLVDGEGLPAVGFTVSFLWDEADPLPVPEGPGVGGVIHAPYGFDGKAATDEQGSVRFEALPEGQYTVKVQRSERSRKTILERELRLDLGQGRYEDWRLPVGTVTLRGVVTRLGVAVEGAEVRAGPSYDAVGPVLTDDAGRFRIAGQSRDEDSRLTATWVDPETGKSWEAIAETDALELVTLKLLLIDDE
ncbi:MAG: hypothetical protein ACI9EF_000808 [Pseudohongiellaceae bacterium]